MSSSTKILMALALCLPAAAAGARGEASSHPDLWWRQAGQVIDRLYAEKEKLILIGEEVERLRYLVEDLRALQVYPPEVTRLRPADDIWLDKRIDRLERNHEAARQFLEEGRRPLEEAVAIAREMLRMEPNADMLEILRKDNIDRVGRLLKIQRRLNAYWDDAFEVLASLRTRSGLGEFDREGRAVFEESFLRVLMANLGRGSERFYGAFNEYKDSLAARSDRSYWARMAKIDLDAIDGRMGAANGPWIQSELERLSRRFHGRIAIGAIHYLLGRSYLLESMPGKAAEVFGRISPDSRYHARGRLGILQAMFEAGRDDSVAALYGSLRDGGIFRGDMLRQARFLAIQSLYALERDSVLEAELLSSRTKDAYHYKSLLIYAKSLVRRERIEEARKVLSSLKSQAQLEPGLVGEAEITLAHLNYEQGALEAALQGYKGLIGKPGLQAEALYGMVWCNIRLGDLEGAEFILKKLISQYPDNAWAMEGFLVLIRRIALKADGDWGLLMQVEEGKEKLARFRDQLEKRVRQGLLPRELAEQVRKRLDETRRGLEGQKTASPEEVAMLYRQALGLCEFVEKRYRTGEYSELAYSDVRENLLHRLNVLEGAESTPELQGSGHSREAGGRRSGIRKKLFESRVLAMDLHVKHKAWLKSYLKVAQKRLNARMAASPDSGGDEERRRLEARSYALADQVSEKLVRKAGLILDLIEKIAAGGLSASVADWLLFQRGLQRFELEEHELRKRWASYQWLKARGGPRAHELPEPKVRYREFEEPWRALVADHPASAYAPAALYYLGFSQTARGARRSGLRHFETLAAQYPESPYAPQALIFIGEYYFNENRLAEAETAFDRVLDHPESKYFEQALYKLAWTRYRMNAYKGAISSFTFILEEANSKKNSERKALLTDEALQFAALSIAESDTTGDGGIGQTRAFAEKLGDAKLGARLMHRMSVIYAQQGRLGRARQAFEMLLANFPDYGRPFEPALELASAYERERRFALATEIRTKLFRHFNRNSRWYSRQEDAEVRAAADSICRRAMEQVAMHHLWEAEQVKEKGGPEEVRRQTLFRAISAYEGLLKVYPDHAYRSKYAYNQAEAYFALGEFSIAAKMYLKVSQWDDGEYRRLAAYNAIVAAQELLGKSQGADDEKEP